MEPAVLTATDVAWASPAGGAELASATDPRFVPPVVHSPVAIGPQRKNVTLPVGVGGFDVPVPKTVARSVTAVPGETSVASVTPALGVVVRVAPHEAN